MWGPRGLGVPTRPRRFRSCDSHLQESSKHLSIFSTGPFPTSSCYPFPRFFPRPKPPPEERVELTKVGVLLRIVDPVPSRTSLRCLTPPFGSLNRPLRTPATCPLESRPFLPHSLRVGKTRQCRKNHPRNFSLPNRCRVRLRSERTVPQEGREVYCGSHQWKSGKGPVDWTLYRRLKDNRTRSKESTGLVSRSFRFPIYV